MVRVHQARVVGDAVDARTAPSRCVWKVTVAKPKSYSVIFDVNRGFMFEIVGAADTDLRGDLRTVEGATAASGRGHQGKAVARR